MYMGKKIHNTSSATTNPSPKKSSKSTGQKVKSTVTSVHLLPTPTGMDSSDGIRKSTQQSPHTAHSVSLKDALHHPLFLRQASPANLSLKPDEAAERRMTVSSGEKCCEL